MPCTFGTLLFFFFASKMNDMLSALIFLKIFFELDNTSPTKANDVSSDFAQIPATMVPRKSRLRF
jgi:hypothetical protein